MSTAEVNPNRSFARKVLRFLPFLAIGGFGLYFPALSLVRSVQDGTTSPLMAVLYLVLFALSVWAFSAVGKALGGRNKSQSSPVHRRIGVAAVFFVTALIGFMVVMLS